MTTYPARRKRSVKSKKIRVLNRSTKKNLHRILAVASLFVISGAVLSGIFLNKYLDQNLASAFTPNSSSYSIMNDATPSIAYIVVKSFNEDPIKIEKLDFIVIDKGEQKVKTYHIPTSLEFDIPGKFGEERIDNIFALGALNSDDKLSGGLDLVKRTVFKLFGFDVDKYVLVEASASDNMDTFWRNGADLSVLSLFSSDNILRLKSSMKTDMSLTDFREVSKIVRSLPDERFLESTIQTADPTTLEDIDEDLRDITLDDAVSKENKSIAVLNGSDIGGLASFGGRVVQNMGGRLVAVNNSSRTYDESYIIADDTASSTVSTLAHVFNIKNIVKKADAGNFTENEISRSEVVLILGFDTSKYLY